MINKIIFLNKLESGLNNTGLLKKSIENLNVNTVTMGLVAAIFSCTGPPLIIINSALQGHLSAQELSSWLFGVYFFGGLISLFLSFYYRTPLAGAYTIPGAVMMGSALAQFSFQQAIGAYMISGIIIFLLGLSGLMSRLIRFLPQPIVMAMIAGTLVRFGIGIITNVNQVPLLGGGTLIAYLLVQRFTKRIPPIFGSLLVGIIVLSVTGMNKTGISGHFLLPHIYMPEFSFFAILSISLPMVLLILGSENAQTIGVIKAQGYFAPVNMITTISGVASIFAALFGAHAANMAGVSTAICASPDTGSKGARYMATVTAGVIFIMFGIFSSLAVTVIQALPIEFINIIAGLSMLSVLSGAYRQAFGKDEFQHGSLFAILIAMSGVNLLNISAPFWALLGGVLTSLLLDYKDFSNLKKL